MIGAARKYRLGDLASFVSGGTPSKQMAAYWGGDTPWVSAKDLKSLRIASSIDTLSEDGKAVASLVPSGALLILVRGMSLFKSIPLGIAMREVAINQDLKGLVPNDRASSLFLAYSLLAHEDALLQMVEAAGHGTGRLDTDALKDFVVRIPSRDEQDRIVAVLTTWDSAIEKAEQLIAAKSMRLDCLREHYLNKPKDSYRAKLHAVTRESTARNCKRLGREAIMAVTKQSGMRPMREETIAASIERYKIVRPNAFAYNPMRLNIGSIAMSSFDDDVLVSPDYVVFECDESKLLSGYLNHLRRTRLWAGHFEAAGSGGVRIRIYYDDLGAFSFWLPEPDVQQRIVALLDACLAEIETLERYRSALQEQKRGLMQKLRTGQWRVRTEIDKVPA
jgi:type I restriction enzyme S subunit